MDDDLDPAEGRAVASQALRESPISRSDDSPLLQVKFQLLRDLISCLLVLDLVKWVRKRFIMAFGYGLVGKEVRDD